MVNLGDKVKDTVTGFSGIAVARTEWISGCARITVQPDKLSKGEMIESQTFDESLLNIIKPKAKKRGPTDKGGPRPSPQLAKIIER